MSHATLDSPPPPGTPPTTPAPNGLGLAALILGVVAFVAGCIPFVGFGSWVVALVGAILGVVALTKRGRKKGAAATGLVLSLLAIIVGFAVSIAAVVGLAAAAQQSLERIGSPDSAVDGGADSEESSPDDDAASAGDDRYGDFDTLKVNGKGDEVVALPDGATAGIVTATYSGTGNFIIAGQDAANRPTTDLLVNSIGKYKGTTAWGLMPLGEPATAFRISAKGKWKLTVKPVSSAKALPESGKGDGVYRYDGGATTWTVSHKGDSNFLLVEYTSSPVPNLAVNEIGAYSGDVPAQAGPAVVTVNADGKWRISG